MILIGKLTKTMSYPKEKWQHISDEFKFLYPPQHWFTLHYSYPSEHVRSHVLLIVNAVFFVASNFYWKLR